MFWIIKIIIIIISLTKNNQRNKKLITKKNLNKISYFYINNYFKCFKKL